jgi:uncharacterized repeat protein (TIGR01451 family)
VRYKIVEKEVDLELDKELNNNSPSVGEQVMFTITVTNKGPHNATGVEVKDTHWPTKLTYSSDDSGGDYNPNTRIWWVGDLAVGASATLHITATVNDEGDWVNVAEVYACDQPDKDSTPNNDEPLEDDQDEVGSSAVPTAVTLSSFAARSSAGGSARGLWLVMAGLTVLAAGGLLWAKRQPGRRRASSEARRLPEPGKRG